MLKRIYQHFYLIASVLFGVLGFFFLKRLTGDSPKVADIAGLVVCCAFFGWTAIAGMLEELEGKLKKLLEPGTGGKVATGSPTTHYPRENERDDLNHSLINTLGIGLLDRGMDAQVIGNFIRKTADAIKGIPLPMRPDAPIVTSSATCTCGPNDGCSNCPTAGAKADQAAEAEILAAGLTAPRVTAAQIQALMDKLTWRYEQPEGTTSTFAHAFLGRFYLATGHSACVSLENFNADLGQKYAREQAEGKARDKLWELEGYKLHSELAT